MDLAQQPYFAYEDGKAQRYDRLDPLSAYGEKEHWLIRELTEDICQATWQPENPSTEQSFRILLQVGHTVMDEMYIRGCKGVLLIVPAVQPNEYLIVFVGQRNNIHWKVADSLVEPPSRSLENLGLSQDRHHQLLRQCFCEDTPTPGFQAVNLRFGGKFGDTEFLPGLAHKQPDLGLCHYRHWGLSGAHTIIEVTHRQSDKGQLLFEAILWSQQGKGEQPVKNPRQFIGIDTEDRSFAAHHPPYGPFSAALLLFGRADADGVGSATIWLFNPSPDYIQQWEEAITKFPWVYSIEIKHATPEGVFLSHKFLSDGQLLDPLWEELGVTITIDKLIEEVEIGKVWGRR